jgi:CheY-like chemotaxis protein
LEILLNSLARPPKTFARIAQLPSTLDLDIYYSEWNPFGWINRGTSVVVKQVLVIDDEDDIREITQASLEIMAGLKVIVAASSAEGLLKAESEQPDAILLDVMLPEMDGLTVFQKLQDNPSTQHIPVILLTAKVQPCDRRRFTELGVEAVLAKPFKPSKLAADLLQILGWTGP